MASSSTSFEISSATGSGSVTTSHSEMGKSNVKNSGSRGKSLPRSTASAAKSQGLRKPSPGRFVTAVRTPLVNKSERPRPTTGKGSTGVSIENPMEPCFVGDETFCTDFNGDVILFRTNRVEKDVVERQYWRNASGQFAKPPTEDQWNTHRLYGINKYIGKRIRKESDGTLNRALGSAPNGSERSNSPGQVSTFTAYSQRSGHEAPQSILIHSPQESVDSTDHDMLAEDDGQQSALGTR